MSSLTCETGFKKILINVDPLDSKASSAERSKYESIVTGNKVEMCVATTCNNGTIPIRTDRNNTISSTDIISGSAILQLSTLMGPTAQARHACFEDPSVESNYEDNKLKSTTFTCKTGIYFPEGGKCMYTPKLYFPKKNI